MDAFCGRVVLDALALVPQSEDSQINNGHALRKASSARCQDKYTGAPARPGPGSESQEGAAPNVRMCSDLASVACGGTGGAGVVLVHASVICVGPIATRVRWPDLFRGMHYAVRPVIDSASSARFL